MKKGRVNTKYEEKYIKANRTFPVSKTILLIVILLFQIGILLAAFLLEPQPQDVIRQYDVTVEAREDGSLDILYHFVWEAVDTSEELTWIEIGMANGNYRVYPESVSDTVRQYTRENNDGEVYLVLDLDRAYTGGEVLEFSFKINQKACSARTKTAISLPLSPAGSMQPLWRTIPSAGRRTERSNPHPVPSGRMAITPGAVLWTAAAMC